MLRIVFVGVLVMLFVVPVYHVMKRKTTRIRSELEDEVPDADERLTEIRQKQKKLKADCKEELRSAEVRAKAARKVQNQL